MKGDSLSLEKLNCTSGGADVILNDGQQAKIRKEIEKLRKENLELKKRTARAEVLNDIYQTNKTAKLDSDVMKQVGKALGVIQQGG
jgi:hypothetical protein